MWQRMFSGDHRFAIYHYVWQLCSGTMFEKHVRGFQEACSTGHYVRQDVRMFEIVRRLNSFVLNPMFECSLNICSDPILVVNVRKTTKDRARMKSSEIIYPQIFWQT